MKEITLDKVKYSVPEKWEEVTIQQQINVSKIAEEQKHVKMLAIIAGYTSIPIEVLKNVKFNRVESVMKKLEFLKETIPTMKTIDKITFKNVTYTLQSDIFELKTEDFLAIMTAQENFKDNPVEMYPVMLAVIYRKEGETSLDDYDLDERYELFKELPLPIGYSVYSFFLTTLKNLEISSRISSPQSIEYALSVKFEELQNLLKPSEQHRGMKWYTRLLIMIMREYVRLLKKRWDKYSNSSQLKNITTSWWKTFKKYIKKMLKLKRKVKKDNKDLVE